MKLSIIVPCYNEAKSLPTLIDRFASALTRPDIELVLVNNGSSDDTVAVLESHLPERRFARLVDVAVNQGYGYGVLSGLKAARGEYIGWTHADLQTDPGDAIRALAVIEGRGSPQKIYVKGLRRGRPFFDTFFTMGMSAFETIFMGVPLWDINAQPNVFHRSFFDTWSDPPHDFALDLYALYLARRQGIELERIPVLFPEREHGQSHWNTGLKAKWKFIRRTLDFSVALKRRLR